MLVFGLIGGLGVELIGGLRSGLIVGLMLGLSFGLDYGGWFIISHLLLRWRFYRAKKSPLN